MSLVYSCLLVAVTALCCSKLTVAHSSEEGLVFKIPAACDLDDCDVYVKITGDTDSSLLTFTLYGNALAWVAVGFSKTQSMVLAN